MSYIDEYIPGGTYGLMWDRTMPRHEFGEDGVCRRLCIDCGQPCYVDAEAWEVECAATTGCNEDFIKCDCNCNADCVERHDLGDICSTDEGLIRVLPDYQ